MARLIQYSLLAITLSLAHCVILPHYGHRPGGIEPHLRPLKSFKYDVIGKAESKASSFNLFHVGTVTGDADLEAAVSDAIASREGDELIDITWSLERRVWIIGTVNIVHVKGKVIKYRQ